jgi:hypothetical protein
MNRFIQKSLVVALLLCTALYAFSAGTVDKKSRNKSKNRITLNIGTIGSLRTSLNYNLKNGLQYKGSLQSNNLFTRGSVTSSSAATFQKGNTTYVLPGKQKIIIPEVKQGYSGFKLIIRSN